MKLKGKFILVTGGAGFIGSHLVDGLISKEPESIVIITSSSIGKIHNLVNAQNKFRKLKIIKQDASNYNSMKKITQENNFDFVFNLAVIPLPASLIKPKWTFQKNVDITMCICEIARTDKLGKIIHFSSSETLGTARKIPMDEDHAGYSETPYAASKTACDHLIYSYHSTFGIKASIIRPFNVYGPRQKMGKYTALIPQTIKKALDNEPITIYGDGKQTRDYVYVTDVVKGAIAAAESENTDGEIINIASGKEITVNKVVNEVINCLGKKSEIVYKNKRQGDVARQVADISKAERLLQFKPDMPFNKGIKITTEWYKNNRKLWS